MLKDPSFKYRNIANERLSEKEFALKLTPDQSEFWLSLKGFKNTKGQEEICKQTIYEILEYKVQIMSILVEKNLLGELDPISGLPVRTHSGPMNTWQKIQ